MSIKSVPLSSSDSTNSRRFRKAIPVAGFRASGIPNKWYYGVAIMAFGLFILAMGGGLWGLDYAHFYHQWAMLAFDPLCHQAPDRSLSISGTTMAVCSRCVGIYGAFSFGLWFFPLLLWVKKLYSHRLSRYWMALALLIILFDFLGNASGLWINTHLSRIITGVLFGLSLSWFMAGERIK